MTELPTSEVFFYLFNRIREYNEIWDELENIDTGDYRIWLSDRYSYAGGASYLLYKKVCHIFLPQSMSAQLLKGLDLLPMESQATDKEKALTC